MAKIVKSGPVKRLQTHTFKAIEALRAGDPVRILDDGWTVRRFIAEDEPRHVDLYALFDVEADEPGTFVKAG